MSYKDRIKKARKQLEARHTEEMERQDRPRFGSIFNFGAIPNNIPFWSCEEGRHQIDIVPFFAGLNHPHVAEGDFTYCIELQVHRNIGPTDEVYVCPAHNFKRACPICEYIDKNKPLPKEEFTQIAVKDRTIYYIWCHDDAAQEKEGVKIWEVAKFFFSAHLKELSKDAPTGAGGVVVWSDWTKEGKSIAWTRKGSRADNTQFLGHKFVDRQKDLPEELLETVADVPLDSLINMHPTYEEMYESFYGSQIAPATPTPTPSTLTMVCPKGGELGKSWKEFDYCDECPLWDACSDAFDEINKSIGSEPPGTAPDPKHTTTGRKGRRARR
jgi:hypothetical protein